MHSLRKLLGFQVRDLPLHGAQLTGSHEPRSPFSPILAGVTAEDVDQLAEIMGISLCQQVQLQALFPTLHTRLQVLTVLEVLHIGRSLCSLTRTLHRRSQHITQGGPGPRIQRIGIVVALHTALVVADLAIRNICCAVETEIV
uniref:Uncharacterized protein n=1 Tax=uncultured marine virus TaxID=186617 RepID=A0A0F7L8D1_9VIRU|nr:hypothetical protein [uncultured marine virus]